MFSASGDLEATISASDGWKLFCPKTIPVNALIASCFFVCVPAAFIMMLLFVYIYK